MRRYAELIGNYKKQRIKSLYDNKLGKSTLAYHADSPVFLATEVGYKTLPGAIAQDITSWADMKQALSQLKKPEVKDMFKTIVVDTIDVAADMCVKYICNANNVNALGEIPYGQGWVKFKTEFNDTFRSMTQLGYSCIFIGHDKEAKDNDGNITNIRPALSNSTREVIGGMA